MFSKQIGKNMEVYVDDMLVKSREELAHLDNLKEMFTTLKKIPDEVKPCQVRFWGSFREVPKLYGVLERDRSELGKGASYHQYVLTQNREGSLEADGKDRSFKQVCL